MRNTKKQKIWKGIVIGIVLTALTMFVLLTVFLWLFFTGGPAKETKDLEKYETIFELRANTGLIIFPEQISKKAVETDFYYYFRDIWNTPTYEIYLQCTYEPEEYKKEIERLENTYKRYAGKERRLLRDTEEKYNYPVYIAVENHHYSYEYAMLTGENQITYVSMAFREKEDVNFNKEYLPSDFMTEVGRSFTSGYSIYISSISSSGISYDETREMIVEVTDAHMERIEDSYFIVRVKLDEENREIITECVFDYQESLYDEEADSTVYSQLNGMFYKDLKLNEDRTKAIVTYYEDKEQKEEKEFVIELPFPE